MSTEDEARDPNIMRHEARERDFEPASGDDALIEEVSDHFEQTIGPILDVFHEILSDLIHVDIHRIPSAPDRPYVTLFTTGMAERAMTAPEGAEELTHAELMIKLPPSWRLPEGATNEETLESDYWPIRWLKILARLPHEYQTWLHYGHTVPNQDPPVPFAENTRLCGVMLAPPMKHPESFWTLERPNGDRVSILQVLPLYTDELELKLRHGAEAIYAGLDLIPNPDIVDPNRPSIVDALMQAQPKPKKKKRFGLF